MEIFRKTIKPLLVLLAVAILTGCVSDDTFSPTEKEPMTDESHGWGASIGSH